MTNSRNKTTLEECLNAHYTQVSNGHTLGGSDVMRRLWSRIGAIFFQRHTSLFIGEKQSYWYSAWTRVVHKEARGP